MSAILRKIACCRCCGGDDPPPTYDGPPGGEDDDDGCCALCGECADNINVNYYNSTGETANTGGYGHPGGGVTIPRTIVEDEESCCYGDCCQWHGYMAEVFIPGSDNNRMSIAWSCTDGRWVLSHHVVASSIVIAYKYGGACPTGGTWVSAYPPELIGAEWHCIVTPA